MVSTPARSPTRPNTPNAHPYPIKTTSTGILTRSNSSSAHGSWARHKYSPVPSSPKPDTRSNIDASPTRSDRSMSASPSPSKYSRSWTGRTSTGERVKLPRHPYLWTPVHLGAYLSTSLNGSDGEPLDPDVVQHIVEFVHEQKIGGRAFLGLDQEDFQEMDGVNPTWADALWDSACALRAAAAPYRPSRISSAAYKRGRVRGIVGVFERSASESSDIGEDEPHRRSHLRRSNVPRSGSESAGDDVTLDPEPIARRSGGPTPRASYVPESSSADHDITPHTREVEIVSVANADAELSMAELYERTYGVPAPTPANRHEAVSDGEDDIPRDGPGETVKITVPEDTADVPTLDENAEAIAVPAAVPPSLADLFVPTPAPAAATPSLERNLMPLPVIVGPSALQNVYVLPSGSGEAALSALDVLKTRLAVVEDRIATMERKDTMNGDIPHSTRDRNNNHALGHWTEPRQSAYVLLAGAMAGISIVLVPFLVRHLWNR